MSANLTVTDHFAGIGGSSTGMIQIPGVEVVIAANHWRLACEIHNLNHPDTDHAAVDLHQEEPSFFPTTDVLWASPECTKWSQANGTARPAIEEGLFEDPLSDDAATRSRLLMFDVLRFAEHHRYRYMIVENVVDIATQTKYRLAWHEWRRRLVALGYRFKVVSLNSMHAQAWGPGAPQSRDRIYIVCWREGERAPDLERAMRPRAFCPKCDRVVEANQAWKNGRTVGKYRSQYVYVHGACGAVVEPGWLPAAAAIDWSIPGERIGDRAKPLAEKTLMRIAAGIARYWGPLHVQEGGNQFDAADPKHNQHGDPNGYYRAWPIAEYLRTLDTGLNKGLVVPSGGTWNEDAVPVTEPHRTLTTRDAYGIARPPFVAELRGGGSDARPVSEPAATFCASGNHHALVAPFVTQFRDRPRDLDPHTEPLRTIVADGANHALVHRMNSGGAEMTTPVFEELRTLTTKGHQAVLSSGKRRLTPSDIAEAREMLPDVLFRMFRPHEVAAGMAFPPDYRFDATDPDKKGRRATGADIVKGAGNAVTPPAARDLMGVVYEAATGEAVAA